MAGAPRGNKNSVGNAGGKSLQDRLLAARVRRLALSEIELTLNGKHKEYGNDRDFKKQILLKLAATVLPRLNEHTGPDGDELQIGVVMLPTKNASTLATPRQTGDSPK